MGSSVTSSLPMGAGPKPPPTRKFFFQSCGPARGLCNVPVLPMALRHEGPWERPWPVSLGGVGGGSGRGCVSRRRLTESWPCFHDLLGDGEGLCPRPISGSVRKYLGKLAGGASGQWACAGQAGCPRSHGTGTRWKSSPTWLHKKALR